MTTTNPAENDHQEYAAQAEPGPGLRRFLVSQTEQFVVYATHATAAKEWVIDNTNPAATAGYHGTQERTATWVDGALRPERA